MNKIDKNDVCNSLVNTQGAYILGVLIVLIVLLLTCGIASLLNSIFNYSLAGPLAAALPLLLFICFLTLVKKKKKTVIGLRTALWFCAWAMVGTITVIIIADSVLF